MTTSVSIILVDYNNHQYTIDALDSLDSIKTPDLNVNVIVVDNASSTPLDLGERSGKLPVELLTQSNNLGFAGGNNIAIRHALESYKPDYILLLNNDTRVHLDFLTNLVKFAESHRRVGAVSPKIYFEKGHEFHAKSYTAEEKGKVIWFAGGSIDWANMFAFHRGVDEVDRGHTELTPISRKKSEMPFYDYEHMDFASGCCVLFPSRVLQQVGLFDEDYFMYWEDVDLSHRISKAGYQIYYCPESVIWHINAGSSGGSGSEFHQKYQRRNRVRFALKYAPLKTKLLVAKDAMMGR